MYAPALELGNAVLTLVQKTQSGNDEVGLMDARPGVIYRMHSKRDTLSGIRESCRKGPLAEPCSSRKFRTNDVPA